LLLRSVGRIRPTISLTTQTTPVTTETRALSIYVRGSSLWRREGKKAGGRVRELGRMTPRSRYPESLSPDMIRSYHIQKCRHRNILKFLCRKMENRNHDIIRVLRREKKLNKCRAIRVQVGKRRQWGAGYVPVVRALHGPGLPCSTRDWRWGPKKTTIHHCFGIVF